MRPQARTSRSGDEHNNYEATAPPTQKNTEVRKEVRFLESSEQICSLECLSVTRHTLGMTFELHLSAV